MKTKGGIEIWEIPEFPQYYISLDGRMFSGRRGPLKELVAFTGSGYRGFAPCSQSMTAHVALLLTFVGPRPDGMEASFLDGDKTNYSLSNLGWRTRQQIVDGEVERGTHHKILPGTPSINRRLSNEQVREVRARLARGDKQCEIAKDIGVDPTTITFIKQGRVYQRDLAAA